MTRASKSANSYSIKADSFAEFAHNMLMESIDADLARGDTDLALFKAQYSGEQRIIKYVNVQIDELKVKDGIMDNARKPGIR